MGLLPRSENIIRKICRHFWSTIPSCWTRWFFLGCFFLPLGCLRANQGVVIFLFFSHFFALRYNFRLLPRNTNQHYKFTKFASMLLVRMHVSLSPIFGYSAGCGGDLQNLLHLDWARLVFLGSYSKFHPGLCFKYSCDLRVEIASIQAPRHLARLEDALQAQRLK